MLGMPYFSSNFSVLYFLQSVMTSHGDLSHRASFDQCQECQKSLIHDVRILLGMLPSVQYSECWSHIPFDVMLDGLAIIALVEHQQLDSKVLHTVVAMSFFHCLVSSMSSSC